MCYHPNILFWKKDMITKVNGDKGKSTKIYFANDPRFKGYEYYLELNEQIKKEQNGLQTKGYKMIPCGKCISCRNKERYMWATRIELETKQYNHNYFITLTYNDQNLYIPEYIKNKKTNEIYYNDGSWQGSLNKKDLQQFIKSTRNYFERNYDLEGIKFYACGEYGEIGERPHYHIILMNCPDLELEPIGKTGLLTNKRLEQIWHKGFITITKTNWETIAYTAGYCQKKKFGKFKDEYYGKKGQIRETNNYNRQKVKMSQTNKTIKEQLEIEEETAYQKQIKYRKKGNFINESLYR